MIVYSAFTISRTLTNWLGKSASSWLPKIALSLAVPVAASIRLSTAVTRPVAYFALKSRLQKHVDRRKEVVAAANVAELVGEDGVPFRTRQMGQNTFGQEKDGAQ